MRAGVVGDVRGVLSCDRGIIQNGGNPMRSNCLIFAIWRTVRRGGVLILQRSHAGPYLHSMWASKLPDDLPVEHFAPADKTPGLHMEPLFIGDVEYRVGERHAEPPKEKLGISLVFSFFWLIQLLGWAALVALLAFPIYSYAADSRVCETRQERSYATKAAFRRIHACPATGKYVGACPGWQVDHVIPLAIGGVFRMAATLFSQIGDEYRCFTSYISAKYNLPTKDF